MKRLKKVLYKHSGKISVHGVFLMPFVCWLTAFFIGGLYGYLNFNNISIYFNALFILLVSYFESALIGYLGRYFRVRNYTFTFLVSFVAAVLIIYMSWVGWFFAFSRSFRSIAGSIIQFDPYVILKEMSSMAQNGYWAVGDYVPKGATLWMVWAIEALIPFMICIYRPQQTLENKVYCEKCALWLDDVKIFHPFLSIDHTEDFVKEILAGNFKLLAKLNRVPVSSTRYTQLELIQCPQCSDFLLLSIVEITRIMDSHGHEVLDRYPILINYIISPDNYEKIKQLFRDRSTPLKGVRPVGLH